MTPETTVSIALDRADVEQLRSAIRRRLLADSGEAGADDDFTWSDDGAPEIEDPEAFEEARVRWRRGDRREALRWLEAALGRDFIGLGELKPEDL